MSSRHKALDDMTVEELREECRLSAKEAYDAQRKIESVLMDRARWERATATAIRRREWEYVAARDDHYAKAAIQQRILPLTGLLYRIEQLGERAGTKDVAALKEAAQAAGERIAWAKDTTSDAAPIEATEAEITRLRQVITDQGRALHPALSPDALPCRCAGCELIRAMDVSAPSVQATIGVAEAAS